MEQEDTIHLLKECDAGSKMAVSAIDEVLDKVDDNALQNLLEESKAHHEKLGNDLHALLLQYHSEDKDPNTFAKGMAYLKSNMKISMNDSDQTIADLITDGCDMGVKSLYRYLNQYKSANDSAKSICNRLISIEDTLRNDLHQYL